MVVNCYCNSNGYLGCHFDFADFSRHCGSSSYPDSHWGSMDFSRQCDSNNIRTCTTDLRISIDTTTLVVILTAIATDGVRPTDINQRIKRTKSRGRIKSFPEDWTHLILFGLLISCSGTNTNMKKFLWRK